MRARRKERVSGCLESASRPGASLEEKEREIWKLIIRSTDLQVESTRPRHNWPAVVGVVHVVEAGGSGVERVGGGVVPCIVLFIVQAGNNQGRFQ